MATIHHQPVWDVYRLSTGDFLISPSTVVDGSFFVNLPDVSSVQMFLSCPPNATYIHTKPNKEYWIYMDLAILWAEYKGLVCCVFFNILRISLS